MMEWSGEPPIIYDLIHIGKRKLITVATVPYGDVVAMMDRYEPVLLSSEELSI